MFLKACNLNIAKCMTLLSLYEDAADLVLNVSKSTLIDISSADFAALNWHGKRVEKGNIFCYLGYPLGVDVSNKQQIEWVMNRVRKKVDYWKADEWPLHVCLRIVQAILLPYFIYYLPLLDWRASHITKINSLLISFLWGHSNGKRSFPLISWDTVSQPKVAGGLGILDIHCHIIARRATFLKHMYDARMPWTWCMWELIHMGKVYFHGIWAMSDWDKLFSHAPLKPNGRI